MVHALGGGGGGERGVMARQWVRDRHAALDMRGVQDAQGVQGVQGEQGRWACGARRSVRGVRCGVCGAEHAVRGVRNARACVRMCKLDSLCVDLKFNLYLRR